MQTSHAPGQWVVKSLSVYTDYGAGHRHKVADTRQPLFTRECQEANARLIAAAPDLLAYMEKIHSAASRSFHFGDTEAARDFITQIAAASRAAIAKATGSQP